MKPSFSFLLVTAALVAAVSAQDRRLLAKDPCTTSAGLFGNSSSFVATASTTANNTICFKIAVVTDCDKSKACCVAGAVKAPKFKALLLTPVNATCAKKELQKNIKWSVAGSKGKKAKADGAVITVKLSKLAATGGDVCVDLSASGDDGCKTLANLCKSPTNCNVAIETGKYKKAKGEKKVECCSSPFGNLTAKAPEDADLEFDAELGA